MSFYATVKSHCCVQTMCESCKSPSKHIIDSKKQNHQNNGHSKMFQESKWIPNEKLIVNKFESGVQDASEV